MPMKHQTVASQYVIHHLSQRSQRQYSVLTGRAAAGIWAALMAWGFHDQVVLIPANSCYIVLWAVLKSGNHPLLVDVDRRTGNVTVEGLNTHLSSHPAAVIPCHMYGLPAPMQTICEWAQANGVKVIEDAALALGAMVDGQPAGSWGDASIVSFGLGKIVDNQIGGALLTDDASLATSVATFITDAPVWDDHLMMLTNQWNGLYWPLHQYEAQNAGLVQLYPQLFALYGDLTAYQLAADDWADMPTLLRDLPHNLSHRTRLAALYDLQLGITTMSADTSTLILPLLRPAGHILWRYPLLVQPAIRDELLAYLWEQGVHEATRWYPPLRPMTASLAPYILQPKTPAAEMLGASIINLPLDENVDANDVHDISAYIQEFLADI